VTVVEVTIIVDQETILLLGANITNGATTTMSVEIAAIILLDPKNLILTNPKIKMSRFKNRILTNPKIKMSRFKNRILTNPKIRNVKIRK